MQSCTNEHFCYFLFCLHLLLVLSLYTVKTLFIPLCVGTNYLEILPDKITLLLKMGRSPYWTGGKLSLISFMKTDKIMNVNSNEVSTIIP